MIELTEDAKRFVSDNGIREIFLELRYTKGPCNDNLCKMIPHVDVSLTKHSSSVVTLFIDQGLSVYASPPVAASIERHQDNVTISKSRFGKKLTASGITYSF